MNPESPDARPDPVDASDHEEILSEYDLTDGVRGKHAQRFMEGTNLVPLDPDVAAAFPDPAEVNAVLRAVAGIIREHRSQSDSTRRTA